MAARRTGLPPGWPWPPFLPGPGWSGSAEDRIYVRKADRVAVRHRHGQIVAVVEIVSPGNKASRNELRTFVEKSSELIMQGVHLLVIDLFPPSKRDPQGIHKAIWDSSSKRNSSCRPTSH